MTSSLPPEDYVRATATLARSSTIRSAVLAACGLVIGWAGGKLDTKTELAELKTAIGELTSQQKKTVERMDDATRTWISISQQIDGVQRDVVVVAGAALAYETATKAKQKLEAGDALALVYDAERRRSESPASAAKVFRTVAVPRSAR